MFSGQFVLSQLLDCIHPQHFHRCVQRYDGDYKIKHFSCWQQFVCLVFAQLTWRESLRDIEACLNARVAQLYHLGLRAPVKRSTLADALASRDWRIFAEGGAALDRSRASTLHAPTTGSGSEANHLCAGRQHHRSVPVGLSLGALRCASLRPQDPHATGSALGFARANTAQSGQFPGRALAGRTGV